MLKQLQISDIVAIVAGIVAVFCLIGWVIQSRIQISKVVDLHYPLPFGEPVEYQLNFYKEELARLNAREEKTADLRTLLLKIIADLEGDLRELKIQQERRNSLGQHEEERE